MKPVSNDDEPELKDLRSSVHARLNYLAGLVASQSEFAKIAGVNRTQMSRYLNGSSLPRAELLAKLAYRFNVTVDWFFDTGNVESDIREVQFAMAMRDLVRCRDFVADDALIPDGFYLFWKEMFTFKDTFEVLLGRVTSNGSVKKIKFSMIRDARSHGYLDTLFHRDRFCESVVCQSAGQVCFLSSDNQNNIMLLASLVKRSTLNRADTSETYSGVVFCPSDGVSGRRLLVRAVLEKVPSTTHHLLKAGRLTGRISTNKLPENIARYFSAIQLPVTL